MPKIKRAIAVLIGGARTDHSYGTGSAIVPEPGRAPAYRAVTLGRLDRHVAQNELNSPAVAASVMLVRPRGLLSLVRPGQRIVAREPKVRKSPPYFLPPLRAGSRVYGRGDPIVSTQRSLATTRNPHFHHVQSKADIRRQIHPRLAANYSASISLYVGDRRV